ncbi:GNAT family N-acetyltransferase [Epilithonimonas sp.]|uniref:GNAT family N-acetyltransferase n=1 Tax=Epilithonimonas sp. TaxID=2894511 RepID=UPI0035B28E16
MIVKAKTKDIPMIQDLAKRSWTIAYQGIISQDQIDYMLDLMYSEKTLKSHFDNPDYQYYLIKNDENYLGFMGFEFHQEPETTKLHRIYFLKEAQGKGLGKKALEFLKQQAAEQNDKRIILTVNKKNPAQKFYESQGFRIYEEKVLDVGNGFVMDDFLMELLLK